MLDRNLHRLLTIAVAVAAFSVGTLAGRGDVPPDTGDCSKPADIVFLLDDSRSIWGPHFLDMLSFCKTLVGEMGVGPQGTRIAVASFSTGAREEFGFGDYNTKDEVTYAIGTIQQYLGGTTETYLGLKFSRETMFKTARVGVPHILIVITDGVSHDRNRTLQEALATQAAGIEILVIGVGSMDKAQLMEIASKPVAEHFFTVSAFPQLSSIEALVKQKACNPNQGISPTDFPKDQALAQKECQQHPAEVVMVLDKSSSIYILDFQKQLKFVSDLIDLFDIGPTMTRVAAVSFSTNASVEYHLDEYTSKDNLKARTLKIGYTGGVTETALALKLVRESVFAPGHGNRPDVAHVVIVITDGRSQKYKDTKSEAALLKNTGAWVFAIGVGSDVDPVELRDIASQPSTNFVFETTGYDALPAIKNVLAFRACDSTLPPIPPV